MNDYTDELNENLAEAQAALEQSLTRYDRLSKKFKAQEEELERRSGLSKDAVSSLIEECHVEQNRNDKLLAKLDEGTRRYDTLAEESCNVAMQKRSLQREVDGLHAQINVLNSELDEEPLYENHTRKTVTDQQKVIAELELELERREKVHMDAIRDISINRNALLKALDREKNRGIGLLDAYAKECEERDKQAVIRGELEDNLKDARGQIVILDKMYTAASEDRNSALDEVNDLRETLKETGYELIGYGED